MHSIDKKLIKNKLGSVEVNGKRYDVFKPSLQQILTHTVESEEYNEKIKPLLDSNDNLGIIKTRYSWMMREVEIFVPNMPPEIIGTLDEDMRNEIFSILWPSEENGEKKGTKKKA